MKLEKAQQILKDHSARGGFDVPDAKNAADVIRSKSFRDTHNAIKTVSKNNRALAKAAAVSDAAKAMAPSSRRGTADGYMSNASASKSKK